MNWWQKLLVDWGICSIFRFRPWPPKGWGYESEWVTTKDGRRLEIKYPIPPQD